MSTRDFDPPKGFERTVRIGVATNRLCVCCSGIGRLSRTLPIDQMGELLYICETCGCGFAPVTSGCIDALASGWQCQASVLLIKNLRSQGILEF